MRLGLLNPAGVSSPAVAAASGPAPRQAAPPSHGEPSATPSPTPGARSRTRRARSPPTSPNARGAVGGDRPLALGRRPGAERDPGGRRGARAARAADLPPAGPRPGAVAPRPRRAAGRAAGRGARQRGRPPGARADRVQARRSAAEGRDRPARSPQTCCAATTAAPSAASASARRCWRPSTSSSRRSGACATARCPAPAGRCSSCPPPGRAYGLGGEISDPRDAILGAANYLHANGAPGDEARALFRYNPSSDYVRAVSRYARRIRADWRAFYAYYAWVIHYRGKSHQAVTAASASRRRGRGSTRPPASGVVRQRQSERERRVGDPMRNQLAAQARSRRADGSSRPCGSHLESYTARRARL